MRPLREAHQESNEAIDVGWFLDLLSKYFLELIDQEQEADRRRIRGGAPLKRCRRVGRKPQPTAFAVEDAVQLMTRVHVGAWIRMQGFERSRQAPQGSLARPHLQSLPMITGLGQQAGLKSRNHAGLDQG